MASLAVLTSRFDVYSDEKLVENFQAGNEQAFDELFNRYRQKLYNFLYRLVDDKESAMDLVQETFIAVYTSLYRWQPKARFSTWLYTIAINKARTELRKVRRRTKHSPLEIDFGPFGEIVELQLPSTGRNPVDIYDDNMLIETLNKAVQNLPEQQRKIFILRHANDFKIAEIAEMVGIKEGSVKAHLFKAVANILKYFKKAGVSINSADAGDTDE
jgi:RNA polymerase sigma-70 factor, ECF subfamily